jgi:hypothetical protein
MMCPVEGNDDDESKMMTTDAFADVSFMSLREHGDVVCGTGTSHVKLSAPPALGFCLAIRLEGTSSSSCILPAICHLSFAPKLYPYPCSVSSSF